MDRQRLMDSKPAPEQFKTPEEFDEALTYWLSRAGRNLALTSPSPASPQPSRSTDAT